MHQIWIKDSKPPVANYSLVMLLKVIIALSINNFQLKYSIKANHN